MRAVASIASRLLQVVAAAAAVRRVAARAGVRGASSRCQDVLARERCDAQRNDAAPEAVCGAPPLLGQSQK